MTPRSKKLLLGCGIGCMGLVLLSVGSCVGFLVWIQRPGKLLEPVHLLGPDTSGYAEWTLHVDDPGTAALVERLVALSQPASRGPDSPLPPWMDTFLFNQKRRNDEEQIRLLFPVLAAWTLHPTEQADRDHHLFTVSLEQAGNRVRFLDWILGWTLGRGGAGAESERYRGETLFSLRRQGACFFIRGNDLFFASDAPTARRALDRLADPSSSTGSGPELERLLAGLPPEAALRGAVVNHRGELERVATVLTDGRLQGEIYRELSQRVRSASLSGGFAAPASFEARMDLWPRDGPWPSGFEQTVARSLRDALDASGLTVAVESVVLGDRLRVTFRVEDVPALIESLAGRPASLTGR